MNTRKTITVGISSLLMILSFGAQALVISEIEIEVRASTYQVDGSESASDLLNEFNSGSLICDASLDAVDMVGSSQSCGGPTSNIATLISLDLFQDGNIFFEFGPDWGRGGIAFLSDGGSGQVGPNSNDLWWSLNWDDPDVININTVGTGSYTLNLLGFEDCCGGAMSLRYSTDFGETWTIAAVNAVPVPEPAALGLLGFGLISVGLMRRRRCSIR